MKKLIACVIVKHVNNENKYDCKAGIFPCSHFEHRMIYTQFIYSLFLHLRVYNHFNNNLCHDKYIKYIMATFKPGKPTAHCFPPLNIYLPSVPEATEVKL